jgi:hypothetical protein
VFVSHRRTGSDDLQAWLETHALVHSRYRLHVVRNCNVVSDDAIHIRAFDRKGRVGRPVVTVVLQGMARMRAFDRTEWLVPGKVSLLESKAAIIMRQGRDGEPYESLVVEWEPSPEGISESRPQGFEVRTIDDAARARIAACAAEIAAVDVEVPAAARAMVEVLDVLRGIGAPFREVTEASLIEPVPAQTLRLSMALDEMLSDLRRKPMAVDLDQVLGLSLRQINRVVAAFNERYGFNSGGWLDTRSRRRVMTGAVLMTAPGATTEGVSSAVGYASPTAFCRALADAGLPSPGAIAAAVRELRDAE